MYISVRVQTSTPTRGLVPVADSEHLKDPVKKAVRHCQISYV